MEDHLTPDVRAELMAERGDLPSVAAYVASAKDVIAAIMADFLDPEAEPGSVDVAVTLRSWAMKLKDRSDWKQILDAKIFGSHTIRWFLLMDLWNEAGRPRVLNQREPEADETLEDFVRDSFDQDLSTGSFEDVGLDWERDLDRLRQLVQVNDVAFFDSMMLKQAAMKRTRRKLRTEREFGAIGVDVREELDDAEKAADELSL
jgi:hypothetical protein